MYCISVRECGLTLKDALNKLLNRLYLLFLDFLYINNVYVLQNLFKMAPLHLFCKIPTIQMVIYFSMLIYFFFLLYFFLNLFYHIALVNFSSHYLSSLCVKFMYLFMFDFEPFLRKNFILKFKEGSVSPLTAQQKGKIVMLLVLYFF